MLKLINEYIGAIRSARNEAGVAHMEEMATAVDEKAESIDYDNRELITRLHYEAELKQSEIESRAERDRRRSERFSEDV